MKISILNLLFPLLLMLPHMTYSSAWFLGFRMAAECGRNALLEKVVDNKADSGIFPTF